MTTTTTNQADYEHITEIATDLIAAAGHDVPPFDIDGNGVHIWVERDKVHIDAFAGYYACEWILRTNGKYVAEKFTCATSLERFAAIVAAVVIDQLA